MMPQQSASPMVEASNEQIELELASSPSSTKIRRTRVWYAHMFLVNAVEFASESARGLVLPTLFTYCQLVGGDMVFMGLLTSLFSVGRFTASLTFGWMCDRFSFKTVFIASCTISILGNLLYVLAFTPSIRSKTLLAASRLIVGFGAGNRSVCRANIAKLTHIEQRLQYFSILAAFVFLGYALTPGLGGAFSQVHFQLAGKYFQVNSLTAPGLTLALLHVITLLAVIFFYDNSISSDDAPVVKPASIPEGNEQANNVENAAQAKEKALTPVPIMSDRMVTVVMWVFIFLNFNARGILSIFETVNIPLYRMASGEPDKEPNDDGAISDPTAAAQFYLVVGLLGLFSYAAVQVLKKRVHDVSFLLFGFIMLMIGNIILFALSISIQTQAKEDGDGSTLSASHEVMDYEFFVLAEILVWSIGCPLTSAVIVSAFSKVLGTRPQGLLMGLFGSVASIARMLLAFLPAIMPSWEGLFLVNVVMCSTSMFVLFMYMRWKTKAILITTLG